MSDDEFEEALSWEPMDVSQDNSVDASVVPLDPSEDAQFSEQQYTNIQERLTRINRRIAMANSAIAQLQAKIRYTQASVLTPRSDHFAGGDNPFRGDEAGDESNN